MPTPSTTKTTIFANLETLNTPDFDSLRVHLASPDVIKSWSHGEVAKPETINYRTQKPEMEGLFCERIFGPSKDWECYCGKFKRVRYKGVVCDKCGVEVTRSLVRRERMGHIELASPVSHIWFARGVPSMIALILGISMSSLEKVIYFANFIITDVNEKLKKEMFSEIEEEYKSKKGQSKKMRAERIKKGKNELSQKGAEETVVMKERENRLREEDAKTQELNESYEEAKKDLANIKTYRILSELEYQELALKYGHIFSASIGAEAVAEMLSKVDLKDELKKIQEKLAKKKDATGIVSRRMRVLSAFLNNNLRPEWMVMTVLPVIPPDLRPMVQLDGGRFAASDLNDLYRRVINRNNRLKRLKELGAPEVIARNEKRMLQEAVDALIDNSARRGKTVTASTGQKRVLKSIADMLKGKQGRFRRNLLGKRVDYSGRSVIVVGSKLKLHQCGLPKIMALELFKPFVISKLIARELVHNVRSANKFIEGGNAEVWDVLEEIIGDTYVLLNRAPTLHKLGIQAFNPVLIEGKAIQLHPLVCTAYNADFDGDQMAVHVPLTEQAKWEAKHLMLASKNLLKPATGDPITTPSQDIVLGCYYMTTVSDEDKPVKSIRYVFASREDAKQAYEIGIIKLNDKIKVRLDGKIVDTGVGRLIFNEFLPDEVGFINKQMGRYELKQLTGKVIEICGTERTAQFLDTLMQGAFKYLTRSGVTWAMSDLPTLNREETFAQAQQEIDTVTKQFQMGQLSAEEKHAKTIEIWTEVKDAVTDLGKTELSHNPLNPIYLMIESGARGSWGQTTQMMGMKGLVTSPSGETIELPVKANFKGGFDVLEYFISTHGTRKGLTDTALRTANAGYLTRRLVDVSQDIVVVDEDCGSKEGVTITQEESHEMNAELWRRCVGRTALKDFVDKGGRTIVSAGSLVTIDDAAQIRESGIDIAQVRSVLHCESIEGVCQKCYGWDLSYNRLVQRGTAVGIMAAQSIGEPGTQLTMRTFHTGGVAAADITQGLPRVEELFEARNIKKPAILAPFKGKARIEEEDSGGVIIEILSDDEKNKKVYKVPVGTSVLVSDKDLVIAGQSLTEGATDLKELYAVKGKEAVQRYILQEIQHIYSSQGQDLNDKHIEIILRQLFSRSQIIDPGDTGFIIGDVLEATEIRRVNKALPKGKKPAHYAELFLGMTKAALNTSSFLSAASFQQTLQVLIRAAITGQIDRLKGLKENVIIGRLIPAGTGFRLYDKIEEYLLTK